MTAAVMAMVVRVSSEPVDDFLLRLVLMGLVSITGAAVMTTVPTLLVSPGERI